MYLVTWVIEQIFYINYKWRIIFKICESHYYTLVTYNIVEQLHFNFKK